MTRLNKQLKSQVYAKPRVLNLDFLNSVTISEKIDLTEQSDFYQYADVYLKGVNGFVVSREAAPILAWNGNLKLDISLSFQKTKLRFFDQRLDPLDGSCESFLASYFQLNTSDIKSGKLSAKELAKTMVNGLFTAYYRFWYILNDVEYYEPVCPLVFKNLVIEAFLLEGLESNKLVKHTLRFSDMAKIMGNSSEESINCKIHNAIFKGVFRVDIGTDLLNRHVFALTSSLVINGALSRFSDDLFRNLISLKVIYLEILNMREFFHASDNIWLKSINHGLRVDPIIWLSSDHDLVKSLASVLKQLLLNQRFSKYSFPDEDFCVFKHFPFDQGVLPHLSKMMDEDIPVSCTLIYLLQYNVLGHYLYEQRTNRTLNVKFTVEDRDRCQFQARLEYCFNASVYVAAEYEPKMSSYDLIYVVEWIELVGPVIIFPIVSTLGFVVNLLIIVIIRKKKYQTEYFKGAHIYQFMFLNAVFNSIECFISLLSLYGVCIKHQSLFCPSMFEHKYFHDFREHSLNFLSETTKTCSIITSLLFSIERYLSISELDKNTVRLFKHVNLKGLMALVVLVSLLTSMCKLFEDSGSIETHPIETIKAFYNYLSPWVTVLHVGHYVLNDGVLFVINLVVDIMLVRRMRANLAKKLVFVKNFTEASGQSDKDKQKRDEIEKANSDGNKLIVSSLVFFVFCRLPEAAFELHLLFIGIGDLNSYYRMCISKSFCSLLRDISQFFYIISYSFNLLLFYKFNKNFRLACRHFFRLTSA